MQKILWSLGAEGVGVPAGSTRFAGLRPSFRRQAAQLRAPHTGSQIELPVSLPCSLKPRISPCRHSHPPAPGIPEGRFRWREGGGIWSARKLRPADEGRAEITPRLLTGDGGDAQLRRRQEAPVRGRLRLPSSQQGPKGFPASLIRLRQVTSAIAALLRRLEALRRMSPP